MTFPAAMGAEPMLRFLVAVLVLLMTARLLGALAGRVGMPAVVGELLAGVVLGPSVLAGAAPALVGRLLPADPEAMHLIDGVGQLGVLLLVGLTGTHLPPARMRALRRPAVSVSLWGLVIPMAGGVGLGFLVPGPSGTFDRWIFALFLGVAMGVTALPVIAKTLADMRLTHRTVGHLILTAGTVDDTVCWLLLSVLTALATGTVSAAGVTFAVAAPVVLVAAAAGPGRLGVRFVMRRAVDRGPGPACATATLVVLAGAVAAHALRLEPVFGAFVAGLLVGGAGTGVRESLAPLRTVVLAVLAPIFLATAGLRMDLRLLSDPSVALTSVVVLAVAVGGKFAGAYVGARLGGRSPREGLAIGAGMNSRGVVEVVVATAGLRLGVLNAAAYTTIVLVAIVTSVMAPPLLRRTMRAIAEDDDERMAGLDTSPSTLADARARRA